MTSEQPGPAPHPTANCGTARQDDDYPLAAPAHNNTPAPLAGAPYILYTDLLAGPTHGGENDKGVYLSIFGINFEMPGAAAILGVNVKVFIGGAEVDNYRRLGPAKGRSDISQITVQVGALGNLPAGVELPVQVVVNGTGSNINHTFIIQPGNILFVDNINGDDTTAQKNDVTRPWRHVQTPDSCPLDCATEGGALNPAVIKPGDVIVMRGRGKIWSGLGFDNRFARFHHETGTRPNGIPGNGYITLMAYPGEDVHIVPQPNSFGGIHGINGDGFPGYSKWIVISGLRIEGGDNTVYDGPVNLQAHADHWRVVNNELFNLAAPPDAKSAGISGNGANVDILGNHIHHIGGGTLNHGMYFDTGATDVDVAYNEVENIKQGNLIQTYDNLGTADLNNVNIHHNLLHDGGRYGLNISGGTHSLNVWNNVIYNTAFSGVRFSVQSTPSSNFVFVYNTLYNNNMQLTAVDSNAPVLNDWNLNSGTALIANNIVYAAPLTIPLLSDCYYLDTSDGAAIRIKRNLWFGRARGAPPPQDQDPVGGTDLLDPLFADSLAGKFNLLPGSPAIQQGLLSIPLGIIDDFRETPRPTASAPDVGAYQYTQ
ncbi:MAG: right-handed parallel beta-helix repeat-containing protein [Gammaproteobacteria bacterium]|nr:right-handed parallel beta-helix repeat-containing protein [Gammaproteobacteria bacterium]